MQITPFTSNIQTMSCHVEKVKYLSVVLILRIKSLGKQIQDESLYIVRLANVSLEMNETINLALIQYGFDYTVLSWYSELT